MDLKYNKNLKLNISVGKNRFETKWKNIDLTWNELVNKLSQTHHTYETMNAYMNMKKPDQDGIKDIGGFVGGTLKEGKRKNGYVESRSLITLDADNAPKDLWSTIQMLASYAMVCYSTHKHTPDKPRLRLVIPLSRTVSAEEYEAIARKIADSIGMDYMDDTTYEAARLMFWPSTPSDGHYFFDVIDAPVLNPDDILSQYQDWRDTSFWPESSRSAGIRKKTADKQGDPLAKGGNIGVFCRTYPIESVIATFLTDVYKEFSPGRYTYVNGSTAGGLVIYDDKFAYSNHSTDPISGQLCNAFDLVRIHKFGQLDEGAKEDTPINKLPSWVKMMELVSSDANVRVTIGTECLNQAKEEFGTKVNASDTSWLKDLSVDGHGEFESTIDNMVRILKHDPNLLGLGGHNLFTDRYEVLQKLPWQRHTEYWSDLDDASLRHYMESTYKIEGRQKLIDAVTIVFEDGSFHPVKDYIESATWDGTERVEALLIDYLGAEDNDYVRTVTRKTLVAAVARIYNPGCKFDYMLTLIGKQGIGKSLFVKKLGGAWASDTLVDIKGKEAYEALDGVWIMEMSELVALKKSDREAIKSYISKQDDTYRKAYQRNVTVNKRKCIFIGTTNDNEFLDDATGNRRFWVVETDSLRRKKTVWDDLTEAEISQIWAEALELYRSGENIMNLSSEINEKAEHMQKLHAVYDDNIGIIEEFLNKPITANWYDLTISERQQWLAANEEFRTTEGPKKGGSCQRTKISAIEIWCECLGGDFRNRSSFNIRKINEAVEAIGGWKKSNGIRCGKEYGNQRGYVREKC
ncbi:MAG: hypothetical protein HF312_20050 [Ignavibacteria bacterium]|jgi:predicted P-loop ATPase|nr:hypothetical protein [Ignavibacteria bacterium]